MKPKVKSKTLWLNGLTALASATLMVAEVVPDWAGIAVVINALANIGLRFLTTQPIR